MERTEPDLETGQIGPAERPDDPLAAARRQAVRAPVKREPPTSDGRPAPPTPDQEGCYYLG